MDFVLNGCQRGNRLKMLKFVLFVVDQVNVNLDQEFFVVVCIEFKEFMATLTKIY